MSSVPGLTTSVFYEDTVFINGSFGRWYWSSISCGSPLPHGQRSWPWLWPQAGQANHWASLYGAWREPRKQWAPPEVEARNSLRWAPTLTSIPCQENDSISLVITSLLSFWGLAHRSTSAQRKPIFSILMQRFFFSFFINCFGVGFSSPHSFFILLDSGSYHREKLILGSPESSTCQVHILGHVTFRNHMSQFLVQSHIA